MKSIKWIYLAAFFVLFVSAGASSIGGPPPNEHVHFFILEINTGESISVEPKPAIKAFTETLPTVEQVAADPPDPTPNIVYHEVQMGDTLMNISRKYFDTPVYYKEIAKLNGIVDVSYLPQGTRLMIDLSIAKSAPAQEELIIFHTVAAGDTLMSISRQYFGTPSMFKEIARVNKITELGQLKIGMKLKIDRSMKVPPPTVPSL